jgi:hypothetical protein
MEPTLFDTPVFARRRASSSIAPWVNNFMGEEQKAKRGSFSSYLEADADARQLLSFLVSSNSRYDLI